MPPETEPTPEDVAKARELCPVVGACECVRCGNVAAIARALAAARIAGEDAGYNQFAKATTLPSDTLRTVVIDGGIVDGARRIEMRKAAPVGHIIDDQGTVRKVLGTLPVTADGCICNPSEDVFHHGSKRVGVPVWSDDADKWLGEFDHSGAGEWFYPPLAECYSTHAAAESARTEKEGAK